MTPLVTREDLVREALSWEGTPHVRQQSTKRRGCDCKGFVWGVGRELGLPEASHPLVCAKNHRPNFMGQDMLAGLEATLIRVGRGRPGDVMALPLPKLGGGLEEFPRHLAIIIDDRIMMHCYGKGPKRVIRAAIGKSRPVHSYWTWPSLGGS